MATELDQMMQAVMDSLTAEGGQLATVPYAKYGQELPMLAAAPPALSYYFAHFCAQHGDAEFLIDGDIRLSFADTYAASQRVAQGLIAHHGMQKGDRVGIAARNSANWIISFFGILMSGGVATLLNGWWQGEERRMALTLWIAPWCWRISSALIVSRICRTERTRRLC